MNGADVRRALIRIPVPDEAAAAARGWEVARDAFDGHEPVGWRRRRRGPVLAFAAAAVIAAAVLVAVLTPPGQAVVDRLRDAVGRTPAEPALVRLPAPGRLLVLSPAGPWVVSEDGSKRLLGEYGDASWSPRGLYVVAAGGPHLVAVDPGSAEVRWSLARSAAVRDPRWSGGGLDTRIAYRAGSALHVVAGDGSPDAVLAEGVAPVAPAWKPDSHVLAYAGADGRVRVVDADVGRELWHTHPIPGVTHLGFSPEGHLVVFAGGNVGLYGRTGLIRLAASGLPGGHAILDAVVLPHGWLLYADHDEAGGRTAIVLANCFAPGPCRAIGARQLFEGAGRIEDLVISPDGRWLAAAWPDADQLLFFRVPGVGKVAAVADVRREFAPGGDGGGAFPRLAGWAPPAP